MIKSIFTTFIEYATQNLSYRKRDKEINKRQNAKK